MITQRHLPVRAAAGRRRAVVPLAAVLAVSAVLAVLAGACSSDPSTSAKAPAGAKENTTSTAVCTDLYQAGVAVPCATNTVGPGGGVVFHDAGSPQNWGRFLEVAPWNWNPSVPAGYTADCKGGCGADPRSVLKPITDRTQDRSTTGSSTGRVYEGGVTLCTVDTTSAYQELSSAADTGESIGSGAAATAALLGDPACAVSGNHAGAVQLAHSYRGGALDDWYLPSKDELVALCKFTNRNAVGGFNANGWYASSSTVSSDWTTWHVGFDNCGTDQARAELRNGDAAYYAARPIRAFS